AAPPGPRAAAPAGEVKAETQPAASRGSQATLRIDFEKVDLLLNLVGEIVLARGRLSSAAEVQSALLREVGQLRKKVGILLGAGDNGTAPSHGRGATPAQLIEELQRTERVLRETYADLDGGLGGLG